MLDCVAACAIECDKEKKNYIKEEKNKKKGSETFEPDEKSNLNELPDSFLGGGLVVKPQKTQNLEKFSEHFCEKTSRIFFNRL